MFFCLITSLWDILDMERMCLHVLQITLCPASLSCLIDFWWLDALALHPDGRCLYRTLDRFRPCVRLVDLQKNDILTRTGMKRTRFMPVFSSLNINQRLYLSLKIAFEAFTLKVILQSNDILQPFLTNSSLHR